MALPKPDKWVAVSAAKLLVKSMISVIVYVSLAVCAQAQEAQPNTTNQSWTATKETSGANTKASRTMESHTKSGDRSCSSAEWPKKFNCGFEVRMQFVSLVTSQGARVHAEVQDLREINAGEGHIALRLRVRKTDGKWSISEYVPSKEGAANLPSTTIHSVFPSYSAATLNAPHQALVGGAGVANQQEH
jgi:hypothetical protein